jgi:CheY-like chemotaxis protein
VDDLLDVGRITSGKIALKKEPVELNAAVLRAVEACRASAEAHAQALDVHRAEESLLINGDLIRLSQIVLNLLSNAIKYTPDGGRIQVDVARDGEWAVVRISDTGIGITAELLPSVFDLFVQGERSLARTEGGLGIGLTVVRQLVALHGGTVAARSDGPGRGSEFTVLLPVLTHPPLVRGLDAHWEARAPRVVRRVLVVDDNRDSADMMSALLRTWGHEVRTMYNGPAALASAAEHRPDIVLLDIGLPGMDGYAVARELRARGQGGALLLIAFTGYGQDEDRLRVRKAGFDHHLVKPVDPAELEAIIEAMPAPTPSSQDVVESGGKRQ